MRRCMSNKPGISAGPMTRNRVWETFAALPSLGGLYLLPYQFYGFVPVSLFNNLPPSCLVLCRCFGCVTPRALFHYVPSHPLLGLPLRFSSSVILSMIFTSLLSSISRMCWNKLNFLLISICMMCVLTLSCWCLCVIYFLITPDV